MVHMEAWLNKVDEIAAEGPSYKLGHDGSDGTCDCIGLVIGALSRCGVKWPGIHGSNWAARNAMAWLLPVSDASDLTVGDIVYKARRPGETGYSLPERYAADPDRSDYYHVGVVRSVSPLRIVHCTSPGGVVVDTKVGKDAYRGRRSALRAETTDQAARTRRKRCPTCGEDFTPDARHRVYCSEACAAAKTMARGNAPSEKQHGSKGKPLERMADTENGRTSRTGRATASSRRRSRRARPLRRVSADGGAMCCTAPPSRPMFGRPMPTRRDGRRCNERDPIRIPCRR